MIFGGNGTALARNDAGDTSATGHARDADVIVGDNGNIFLVVGTNGASTGGFLAFEFDCCNSLKIIPRAVEYLEYTRGGAAGDVAGADVVHGEAGDDLIQGMGGNDVIYGGLGDDFLHGGAGDDGMSGAEAQAAFYNDAAVSNTNPLGYDPVTRKLAAYDANNPFRRINGFFLNFDAVNSQGAKIEDGKDRLFGDHGNDWLVGGTMNDYLYGDQHQDWFLAAAMDYVQSTGNEEVTIVT